MASRLLLNPNFRELSISKKALTWAVAEDALAFLTDAGLVGRQTIPQQARSTAKNTDTELEHKPVECIWWPAVLADRMDIDLEEAVERFLTKTAAFLK